MWKINSEKILKELIGIFAVYHAVEVLKNEIIMHLKYFRAANILSENFRFEIYILLSSRDVAKAFESCHHVRIVTLKWYYIKILYGSYIRPIRSWVKDMYRQGVQ